MSLAEETMVTPIGEGVFAATPSEGWALVGPNGGYLAAIALRAALAFEAGRPRTLSINFLSRADFSGLKLHVSTIARSKSAACLSILVEQHEVVASATAWLGTDRSGLPESVEHVSLPGRPSDFPTSWERLGLSEPLPGIQARLEERQCVPDDPSPWRLQPSNPPFWSGWCRYIQSGLADRDSHAKYPILLDIYPYVAGMLPFPDRRGRLFAPTLSLDVAFTGQENTGDFLYCSAWADSVWSGYLIGGAKIYSEDGILLAQGQQVSRLVELALPQS